MIKYKTRNWHKDIVKVEIDRETKAQIVLKDGGRVSKRSEYECYFDTFESAKEFLITLTNNEITNLEGRLQSKYTYLHKILCLKEATDEK